MTAQHRYLFQLASIHVPLKEFVKRIRIESEALAGGAKTPYTRANIRAMRKALYTLGLHVEVRAGHYQLCEYDFVENSYKRHRVPGMFAQTERGAMVYALGRFLNGSEHERQSTSDSGRPPCDGREPA